MVMAADSAIVSKNCAAVSDEAVSGAHVVALGSFTVSVVDI